MRENVLTTASPSIMAATIFILGLSAAKGKQFDVLRLKAMIGHDDGAIHMTQMIADASNPDIKCFGENVVKDQSAQIEQMNVMLKRLGN